MNRFAESKPPSRARAVPALVAVAAVHACAGVCALNPPAAWGSRRCGTVRTNTYFWASHVAATRLTCRRARKVARDAATELASFGVGSPYNFGFVVLGKTWGCYWKHGVASDVPFRVHCGPQDTGRGRVDWTTSPGE